LKFNHLLAVRCFQLVSLLVLMTDLAVHITGKLSPLRRPDQAKSGGLVGRQSPMKYGQLVYLKFLFIVLCAAVLLAAPALFASQQNRSGNPIIPGWYADPEVRVFQNEYWIYPTYSAPYDQQLFIDAFSSRDLITWKKHSRILDSVNVQWAKRAIWAPSIVEKSGWYYLFFGANDIQNNEQLGGIGVARSRQPGGPFKDYLGKPLIDKFHNGAQPIDQFIFKDSDGSHYIIYGGWKHCNIAKLNDDFTGFIPFADGTTFKEITPKGYVEGPFMFKKDGKYYFMWSEGGWTGPDYAVAYAIGSSPFGPFERIGKILQQDPSVATGAGHHSVLHIPGSGKWYIVYHRRPLGESDRNHRVVCIDEMHFDQAGFIKPVTITKQGVLRALR
jgi:beta-xylosidase